jgi:hypothetical protein
MESAFEACIHSKSRTAVTKAAFNKKLTLFNSKVDLELKNKLVSATLEV